MEAGKGPTVRDRNLIGIVGCSAARKIFLDNTEINNIMALKRI